MATSILISSLRAFMMQPDLQELAKIGNPQAIADWLNGVLEPEGISISIDREGSRLSIGIYTQDPIDQQYSVALIAQHIQSLESTTIQVLHFFGYQTQNPTPLWSQRITLPLPPHLLAHSPNSHTDAINRVATQPLTSNLQPPTPTQIDRFLVCGLGSLGQYCILNLKKFALREFEVHITAIDRATPQDWEVEHLADLLGEELILGDCRNEDVLLKAGVQECRAILLVTSSESDNIEAAIAARRLNPTIRLVVRSSRHSLNQLLKQQLGDFVAFEPTELPAAAFALAGLRAGILGFFNIGDCRLQVVQQQVQPRDYRFNGFSAATLHKKTYRLLSVAAAHATTPPTRAFYQWHPDTRIQAGDTIAFVEVVEQTVHQTTPEMDKTENPVQQIWQALQNGSQSNVWQTISTFVAWMQANQTRRIIGIGLLTAGGLELLAAVMLKLSVATISWQKAFSIGIILLLGGYGDVFGSLSNDPVPWWVNLVSLSITVISLLFVLGVLGLVADSLISSRFEFLRKRPIPKANHVVLVGFGRVGQRVAMLLREFKQPVVAITEQHDPAHSAIPIPLLVGNPITELSKVNLATAKSVVVVTDDQMLNLEVALMAREAAQRFNHEVGLVVRTYGQRFSNNLINLLPDVNVLAAYALSAEAFAAAAFGEAILGLFRLNEQTILVTEYRIATDDTLVDKLLSQVAYGYGVVPIFHHRKGQALDSEVTESLMPSDDRQLKAGDRLIVLASINGLRRIERGDIAPPKRWRLEAQKPLNETFVHYSGNDLARISGCSLDEARAFMDSLPNVMELDLYDYQAHRLSSELSRQLPITLTAV